MRRIAIAVFAIILSRCANQPELAYGQTAMPYTFTTAPVTNQSTGIPSYQNTVKLLNPAVINPAYLTVEQNTGNPVGSNGTILVIDIEAMRAQGLIPGTSTVNVIRGAEGT